MSHSVKKKSNDTRSIEERWEEFQAAFDRMNKAFVDNIEKAVLAEGGNTKIAAKRQKFKRKTAKEIAFAAGEHKPTFKCLDKNCKCAFTTSKAVTGDCFKKMPLPKAGDWLSCHEERGQSVQSFNRKSVVCHPHATYDSIEIIPVGKFIDGESPPLEDLREFMELYLGGKCKAKIMKVVPLKNVATSGLHNDKQLLCKDALDYLKKLKTGRTAFARIIVTMQDLTPGEGWNFVYGQASLSKGVGVFSFARYSPKFWSLHNDITLTTEEQRALLKKSLRTMVHETGHILGMKHCIYYHCCMNGNNGDEKVPFSLCPICLQKLHIATKCDVVSRYEKLGKFYRKHGFEEESMFIAKRLSILGYNQNLDQKF